MGGRDQDIVGLVMTKDPVTIEPDAPLRKAIQVMIKRDTGTILIAKNGKPVGILTERDVTRRSLGSLRVKGAYEKPVRQFASRPLITARPTTPLWEAFEIMVANKIRRLPVVEGGRLIGIVTERDFSSG